MTVLVSPNDEASMQHCRQLCDYDLNFIEEITYLLDRRLDLLGREAAEHNDPDGWGIFDRVEHTIGVGLVVGQNYLTEIIGPTSTARRLRCLALGPSLALGPRHPLGHSIAEVVNAAANYLKHHAEPLTSKSNIALLQTLGVWKLDPMQEDTKCDYPMGNLFFEMLAPAPDRFSTLVRLLAQWRAAVISVDHPSEPPPSEPSGSR